MFDKYGDAFIVVAPGRNALHVADAEVISQIAARRNDFPKPLDIYGAVDIYGKNVVSVEGDVWRLHRRIAQPSFSERNNRVVWAEALHQGQAIVQSWLRKSDDRSGVSSAILDPGADTMRLSLHVISKAGFGRKMLWPFEEEQQFGPGGEGLPANHEVCSQEQIHYVFLEAWTLTYLNR